MYIALKKYHVETIVKATLCVPSEQPHCACVVLETRDHVIRVFPDTNILGDQNPAQLLWQELMMIWNQGYQISSLKRWPEIKAVSFFNKP